jgi:hypothetical protein
MGGEGLPLKEGVSLHGQHCSAESAAARISARLYLHPAQRYNRKAG